ncbi:Uncharacterised protein [Citrobacter werkmanii]|nr:Uncharacterised protein [Citrobacter werkmanii]
MTNILDPYNIWMYPLITLEGSLFGFLFIYTTNKHI